MAVNDEDLEPNEIDEDAVDDEDLDEDLEEDLEEVDVGLQDDEDEDDDEDESSLEELLAQRAAARRGVGEEDDDESLSALSNEPEILAPVEPLSRIVPIKDRKEFVCRRCFLVKARSQLADADRQLCRDCV